MDIVFIVLGSIFVLYILIMVPLQYSYISSMKELEKTTRKSHNEIYEDMSFENEQLHYHLQGSIFNLPSNLIASVVYKFRHHKK
ncbi:DUF3949 domain-containing protein [Heyndrickxia sp. FSL K6-6286]|uniref:DUF3949 domain-containing protein n=1 Tax=Heyndrickxia sp. FSL K6-6286 TaxID=2921510 RepID=UPI003159DCD9